MLNDLSGNDELLLLGYPNKSLIFALNTAGIGMWTLQLGFKQIVVLDACCRKIFGLNKEEKQVTYEHVISFIHDADREKVETAVKHALDPHSGGGYDIKYRTISKSDGQLKHVRSIGQALFDADGIPYKFSGIAIDVSAEVVAIHEHTKFKLLIENSPDFIAISNKAAEIEYLNPAAYELLGLDPHATQQLKTIDFYAPGELFKKQVIEKSLQQTGAWIGTLLLKHFKTGETIPFTAKIENMINSKTDEIIGRSAHLKDMRPEINAQQALLESEYKFRNVANTSPTGLWLSDQQGNLTYLNKTLADWTGLPYKSLLGTGWANAIIEEDKARSADAFMIAVKNRAHYDVEFRINMANGEVMWCRASGDPFYHEDGTYGGYAGFCMNIHERVSMLSELKESEQRVRSIVEQAPVAIGVLRGKNFIIESGNDSILKVWGRDKSIIGLPLIAALPELVGQPFIELLTNVYDTGEAFFGYETLARINYNNEVNDVYFDFVYAPLKNQKDEINGILVIASEVTKQVLAKKSLQESEARFRGLIEEAPVATCVFTGKDLRIDIANETMLKLWGKGNKVMGMLLPEALPELEGQPFLKILEEIFTTKKPYHAQEAKVDLLIDNLLQTFYFNFTYQPLFDHKGDVYAIMDMAIDVTEQVNNKNRIAEAEARLRIAIETANLGTWEVYPLINCFLASDRIKEWFGVEKEADMSSENYLKSSPDKDKLLDAITKAKRNDGNGILDVEYTVINQKNKCKHILHTVGQTFFNGNGEAYLMTGLTKNITSQRNTEYELENLVQKRTEELQALNEKLENINNELAKSNENLSRSNQELAQYAYVASHDLQEPLRKIRVFADILAKQPSLSEENIPMVNKINKASERMALLIKDLLEFSRLLKSEKVVRPVQLISVLNEVINDFELVVNEKQAIIKISQHLPTIDAVALQINQLFYNLISNALKFVDSGKIPNIEIGARKIDHAEVKKHIPRFNDKSLYYDITIKDNGIGFDVKYADQIFEVFKRLQGRELYPGSGVGLALCKRIVINHGGHLYAESEPGKGATFHIILPDKS